MRHERSGIVAPSVHGHVGFTTSGVLKRRKHAEFTVEKRQRLQDAPSSAPQSSFESVMTHAHAAVVAFGQIFTRRGLQVSQPSDVEQAGDTGVEERQEEPPTDDTGIKPVSLVVAVPASPQSSPRLAEQSRRRTAAEMEQNRKDTLRRRRASASSTSQYMQLRPPALPSPDQHRDVVALTATLTC